MQARKHDEQLQLIAIGHFILAGILLLGVAGMLATNLVPFPQPRMTMPPPQPGSIAGMIYTVILVIMICQSILILLLTLTGLNILKRRRRKLCLVTSILACLMVPLGTLLGVFTLIVLFKPEVSAEFDDAPPTHDLPANTSAGTI